MNRSKCMHMSTSVITAILLYSGLFLLILGGFQTAQSIPTDLFITPAGGGSCLQSSPCDLQSALNLANNGNRLFVAEGTYTGTGPTVVSITKSIVLYGGWDGASTGPVIPNAGLHPTRLDGENQRRVIYISEGITPVINGFIITGGNATGLGGGMFADTDAGGGIYSVNASPIIQNNIINHNTASTRPGTRALGGGVYIDGPTTYAVVRSNHIISNTAGRGIQQGDGGGIFIFGVGEIIRNAFEENVACETCGHAFGGGLYVGWSTHDIHIADNFFERNNARRGGGMTLVWSAAQIGGNTFVYNTATQSGGGFYSWYDMGTTLSANAILSNTATNDGGGVTIYITTGPDNPQLTNNFIARNQSNSLAGGVYASSDWMLASVTMAHNTLVDNGIGIGIGKNMTATLVNNIIASHSSGITFSDPTGTILADHTLFWNNSDDGIRGTHPVDGNPAFTDPTHADYHIGPASAALDSGADAGVVMDFEGDSRPAGAGFDIGADEYWYEISLPVVMRNP